MIREDQLGVPKPALQLALARDAVGLRALRVAWQRLWTRAAANPFLSWSWMEAAWTHVDPHRLPLVISAHIANGELVGVLPLSVERAGVSRVARYLADDTVGSDYLDALVDPAIGEWVSHALWSEALRLRGEAYDVLELREMLDGGAAVEHVAARSEGLGLRVIREPCFRCPHISIAGSFATFLKGTPRAENLRRRQRQLEREPGFAVDVARTEAEVKAALPVFFELHRKRWIAQGGSQGITGSHIERFHREVSARLARDGSIRLYTLRVGSGPLASVYMLQAGATRYFYQSGIDPQSSHRSPGLVLLARTIEDAFSEGAQDYDFLRGAEPYKFDWANGERQTVALRAIVPTFRGRCHMARGLATAAARHWGRRLLGERGYAVLGQTRRRWASR